jgi:transcriptional regulator with XRE-family HTH domain
VTPKNGHRFVTILLHYKEGANPFMERFGEKLRTLREQRGISLRQLTREFGFNSHSYLSGIENGKTKPSVEFVVKVADFFGVDVNKLVRDELELD